MSILATGKNVCLVSKDRAVWPVHIEQLTCLGEDFKQAVTTEVNKNKNKPGAQLFRQSFIGLDINRDILQLLENFVATRKLTLEPITAWKMIEFAERYRVPALKIACMDYFESRINLKTCVPLFRSFRGSAHPIVAKLNLYFITNFEKIVDECHDFYSIDFQDIKQLIDNDYLNISNELKVWRILARWAQCSPKQRAPLLRDILLNSFRYARLHLFEIQIIAKHPLIRTNPELRKTMEEICNRYRKLEMKKDGNNRHCDETQIIARPRISQYSLIVQGGCTENNMAKEVENYSFHTNNWKIMTPKVDYDYSMIDRYYHSVETLNGKYYIIGGSDAASLRKSIVEIDFRTGSCRELAEMNEYRCYLATTVLGDHIYALGGLNGTVRLSSAERYDPKTNTWTLIPDMNVVRSDGAACTHQGKIYIAGGLNSLSIEASLECYNPLTNTWILMEAMLSPRSSFAMVSYNDQLYALGGNDGYDRLSYVEVYDFRSNQWLPIDPMSCRRSTFKAVVMNDELYAVGGYDGVHACGTVEKFNVRSQTWLNVGKLNVSRTAFGLVCFKEY